MYKLLPKNTAKQKVKSGMRQDRDDYSGMFANSLEASFLVATALFEHSSNIKCSQHRSKEQAEQTRKQGPTLSWI